MLGPAPSYSIQQWLEACPQGYLMGKKYGHGPSEQEPQRLLDNQLLRNESIRVTVQLVVGERCALAASSGLINTTPDEASKRFLATQTLDEARHVEIFTERLYDLGVDPSDLGDTIKQQANPNLIHFADVLLEKVHKGDFLAGVVGQNIVLEGLALSVFEMMHSMSRQTNPKLAHSLEGTISDEHRHVGFGESVLGTLLARHPERKPAIERMLADMSHYMLAAFADAFRGNPMPAEIRRVIAEQGSRGRDERWRGVDLTQLEPEQMESLLVESVLDEFKDRLGRIGLNYRWPARL